MERLDNVSRQVDRVTRLVNQLLDASQLGLEQLPLQRTRMDLSQVVRRVAEGLVSASPLHTLELDAWPVVGEFDELRMEQVVHNLVSNAIKYSPTGGTIEVWTRVLPDGEAELVVADRSIGLRVKDEEQLFGRFERGDRRELTGISGIGVDLPRRVHALREPGTRRVELASLAGRLGLGAFDEARPVQQLTHVRAVNVLPRRPAEADVQGGRAGVRALWRAAAGGGVPEALARRAAGAGAPEAVGRRAPTRTCARCAAARLLAVGRRTHPAPPTAPTAALGRGAPTVSRSTPAFPSLPSAEGLTPSPPTPAPRRKSAPVRPMLIRRESYDGSDLVRTRQLTGLRRGVLHLQPVLLFSPRLYRLLRELKVGHLVVEVAHLT